MMSNAAGTTDVMAGGDSSHNDALAEAACDAGCLPTGPPDAATSVELCGTRRGTPGIGNRHTRRRRRLRSRHKTWTRMQIADEYPSFYKPLPNDWDTETVNVYCGVESAVENKVPSDSDYQSGEQDSGGDFDATSEDDNNQQPQIAEYDVSEEAIDTIADFVYEALCALAWLNMPIDQGNVSRVVDILRSLAFGSIEMWECLGVLRMSRDGTW
eukprot:CAMPEP_0172895252 /NCGR_PEP_ID=MMETSP1075-20121228/152686_1 /TAXON_ID=2916 /ORGANISM="Ceratium fusus, Strain PA161109" /LENGTH=212 /DNA_ID=CAMNT_0013750441 /DNA_START=54 /DNA_END=689 /DNA_ORIENTATION=+